MSAQTAWTEILLGKACNITTGKKDVNEGDPEGIYPFFTCSRTNTFSNNFSFDTDAILIAGNGEVGNLHRYRGKFEAYQIPGVDIADFTKRQDTRAKSGISKYLIYLVLIILLVVIIWWII